MICNTKSLALIALVLGSASSENTYTTSGGRVAVAYTVPLEGTASNMSNAKCIEYKEGIPSDYSSGCVSTVYNGNGKIIECAVDFDNKNCKSCAVCQTTDEVPIIGFEVDCTNLLPEKNIQSSCKPFEDDLIKEYLLRPDHFKGTTFDFNSTAPGTKVNNDNGSSGAILVFSLSITMISFLASLQLW